MRQQGRVITTEALDEIRQQVAEMPTPEIVPAVIFDLEEDEPDRGQPEWQTANTEVARIPISSVVLQRHLNLAVVLITNEGNEQRLGEEFARWLSEYAPIGFIEYLQSELEDIL